MKIIDYNDGISTTNIIKDINSYNKLCDSDEQKSGWDKIWELKGKEQTNSLTTLNGYEGTEFDPGFTYKNIVYQLDIKPNSKVLEIGCGAGQFSQLFNVNFDYYGIDYSRSLVNKNISITNSKVFNCEAANLPFKDNHFDYCFSVGVFEYFPSKEYAYKVIKEIERVTKKASPFLPDKNHFHHLLMKKVNTNYVFLIYVIFSILPFLLSFTILKTYYSFLLSIIIYFSILLFLKKSD